MVCHFKIIFFLFTKKKESDIFWMLACKIDWLRDIRKFVSIQTNLKIVNVSTFNGKFLTRFSQFLCIKTDSISSYPL